ncbi:penicillin-binding protein 2 [Sulfobacillus thermosulfidooxidans]|uniref:penicillin-binding protein 2 n=1 Tax=Sulfobacillus thermosulfidooxidans TaxID=28034 RepID=UPI00096BAC71|nr:penicillin-binding protein 2 [Sulfobacillus thermosulfidooxidans]OLZ09224.1 penicillin-binding protein 2 [Sulfobacillus thermosulfidooxidans]OLZ17789.1 penicillin-binding protein 2 [Sulfobacillus thermosulfidooxidans]OLZ22335.1 penicillin-binding protein 2 [Sulfobacillus thermosulfidooxidans]
MINRQSRNRSIVFMAVVTASFAVVGTRFWYLQVKEGSHYEALAQADTLRKLPIPAPRGNIVTADGKVVATSKPSWTLYYLANGQNMPPSELSLLGKELGESPTYLSHLISKQIAQLPPYDPVVITSGLTASEMTNIEENINELPNLRIQPIAVRYYPYGNLMGNIIGYTQRINAQEYQQLKNKGFSMTSIVGAAGLEYEYNQYLHGHAGGEYAEVNRQGQLVKLLSRSGPTPGDTLHLTINWRLEETAQNSLAYVMKAMRHSTVGFSHSAGAVQGAVIAMNPNNGDILAMASLPTYNPNKLLPTNPKEYSSYYTQLTSSPLAKMGISPFIDEAISGWFAPGSVFKPIMAVAALASGVITPTTEIYDPGYFPKDRAFGNWYAPGFGWLNVEQALGLSDDVFFYTLGYDMGINTMDKWMRKFLLNKPTHIDLPGEITSQIPTPARLAASGQGPWTWGWNLNTVIGQGIARYTLISLARADAAIANGGTLYWPHLVSEITTPSGKVVKKFNPVVQGKINLPYSIWHAVHQGMDMSAQDPDIAKGVSGTGYGALAGLPVPVASKTGTAQVVGQSNNYNAFFLTYGPMPHPKILILVYIREGNWGADSGFVARAIYDQYFKIQDPKAQPLFDSVFGLNWKWPYSYQKPAAPKY